MGDEIVPRNLVNAPRHLAENVRPGAQGARVLNDSSGIYLAFVEHAAIVAGESIRYCRKWPLL